MFPSKFGHYKDKPGSGLSGVLVLYFRAVILFKEFYHDFRIMDSWKIFIGRRDDISHVREVTVLHKSLYLCNKFG